MDKRTFLRLASLSAASVALPTSVLAATPSSKTAMPNVAMDVAPISVSERRERLKKAQKLMARHDMAAIVLEPGPAMDYFTGIQWWRSERLVSVVIPREGEIAVVCPFFEEPSIRESMTIGDDVRLWQEHESPFALVVEVLKDRGITKGKIGFENSVRYFILDGVMSQATNMTHVSAEPVTRGCRMFKTPSELALMHKASEITLRAYEYVFSQLELGMSQQDVKALMNKTQAALGGGRPWSMALFNEASAYPHGTKQQQTITPGSLILMDSGCNVHGYQSDISRTLVFGEANKKQRKVWNTARHGQTVAMNAAKLGVPTGKVDDAVRQYYDSQGYGRDYALPGLSHRTGHGIGMEGHESVNFVRGETTPLQKGMCLSNEPGIYIPGEFGVRIEDCIYMTDTGPRWFTSPPDSIDEPLGKLVALKP